LALAAVLAATPASAQQVTHWQNTVSFSPILALFEVLVADYEHSIGPEASIGVGVGYWNYNEGDGEFDDVDETDATYAALDLKGRFYPDRAFKGWELGGSIGVARVGFHDDETGEEDDATGFAYGVEVGHAWLLGDDERWFLGAAIGAKRFWFGEEDNDLPEVMPTGRLSFGIAF
jgi:hypothetical protein